MRGKNVQKLLTAAVLFAVLYLLWRRGIISKWAASLSAFLNRLVKPTSFQAPGGHVPPPGGFTQIPGMPSQGALNAAQLPPALAQPTSFFTSLDAASAYAAAHPDTAGSSFISPDLLGAVGFYNIAGGASSGPFVGIPMTPPLLETPGSSVSISGPDISPDILGGIGAA